MSEPAAHVSGTEPAAETAPAQPGAPQPTEELPAEDQKLVALARASRARNETAEGAAVRDETGRSYAACSVDLPSLKLSAVCTAIAAAVSSGARDVEAAVVVTSATSATELDLAVVRELGGPGTPVAVAERSGKTARLHQT